LYTSLFLLDVLKSFPFLVVIALAVPFGVTFLALSTGQQELPGISPSRLRWALLILPLAVFIIIGFSYAPSAFVRTFPAARARFASHFVLMLGLILEGGILGILASQIRSVSSAYVFRLTAALALCLLILHPVRAASKISLLRYEYQNFATQWDVRDASIRQAVSEGATDLVVVQLDSIGGVGEYKDNPKDWINRCAARFYRLDTLRAP
jgi:hypothetical protein